MALLIKGQPDIFVKLFSSEYYRDGCVTDTAHSQITLKVPFRVCIFFQGNKTITVFLATSHCLYP